MSLSKSVRFSALVAIALSAASPLFAAGSAGAAPSSAASAPAAAASAPALREVALVTPTLQMWPDQIEAHGNIMPWREISVGTEVGGLRLLSVQVSVGDVVKKGQVLAQLNPATAEAELEAVNAQLLEAQATLAQADATLARAKRLAASGGVSKQDLSLYETQKQTATARLDAIQAQVKTQKHKLDSATLIAPDDGVISASFATEGAIVRAGSELFRLIRQGRLEWRAEVKGETLLKLSAGQEVVIRSPLGREIKAHVRQVSPTIDLSTRNGFVYVDLPTDTNFKAGLFVSGTLAIKRQALVVPASAVLHQGSGDQIFTVDADNKVEALDVTIGRSRAGLKEVISGVDEHSRVIVRDLQALKPGESVTVQAAAKS
ncbi:efflux RND transporter periplasmic adaptor subunit [Niveibacterium terrae]|uniref:efflux RND transporter periplasmic adaptor subunit n=1 Tax=Niveibacterium terrae TaxID=3373598 RepID=UPI003A8E58A5